jgi:aldehyde:ferredoxin oxidoreductase
VSRPKACSPWRKRFHKFLLMQWLFPPCPCSHCPVGCRPWWRKPGM